MGSGAPVLFGMVVAYNGLRRAPSRAKDDMVSEPAKDLFDPQAFLAKVGTGKTISVYRKDQIIFSQGEVADTIFYIQKGSVKIVVLSDQGKEAVVGILEAGQFFGEGCMNGHSLRIATSYGDGRKPDHRDNKACNDCDHARRTEIFGAICGLSVDPKQPG